MKWLDQMCLQSRRHPLLLSEAFREECLEGRLGKIAPSSPGGERPNSIPVAQTIGAVCIIYITHLLLHYEVEQDFIIVYNRQRLCH